MSQTTTTTQPTTSKPKLDKQKTPKVDTRLYKRTVTDLQHDKINANDIYIRSNRSMTPMYKRLKMLFFDAGANEVRLWATGKNILPAIKLSLQFSQEFFPFFSTTTTTNTVVVSDEYIPLVETDNTVQFKNTKVNTTKVDQLQNTLPHQDNTNDNNTLICEDDDDDDDDQEDIALFDGFSTEDNLAYINDHMLTTQYSTETTAAQLDKTTPVVPFVDSFLSQFGVPTIQQQQQQQQQQQSNTSKDKKNKTNNDNNNNKDQKDDKNNTTTTTTNNNKKRKRQEDINPLSSVNGNAPLPPPPAPPSIINPKTIVKAKKKKLTTTTTTTTSDDNNNNNNNNNNEIQHKNKKQKVTPQIFAMTKTPDLLTVINTNYSNDITQPSSKNNNINENNTDQAIVQLTTHTYDPTTNQTYFKNGDVAIGHVTENGESMSIVKLTDKFGRLKPFKRQRFVSSICITIHKTTFGDSYIA